MCICRYFSSKTGRTTLARQSRSRNACRSSHHSSWRIIPRTHLVELGTKFTARRILSTQAGYEFFGYCDPGMIELSGYSPKTDWGAGQIRKVKGFRDGIGISKS